MFPGFSVPFFLHSGSFRVPDARGRIVDGNPPYFRQMTTQQELTPELIRAALTTVKFPGFSRDIVSFGLVKKIDIDAENNVTIDLVIESKNADIPRYIFEGVHGVMKHLPGVKHCDVNIEHKAPEAKKGINDDPLSLIHI